MSQGDPSAGKKVKISIKRPKIAPLPATDEADEHSSIPPLQGSSSSFPHGAPDQDAMRVGKIKLTRKRSGGGASEGIADPQGDPMSTISTEPARLKRARQPSKSSRDGDYEYEALNAAGGDFGAEADLDDPDMLEDYDDDYDVLGKPRRAKGTRQRGCARGQVSQGCEGAGDR